MVVVVVRCEQAAQSTGANGGGIRLPHSAEQEMAQDSKTREKQAVQNTPVAEDLSKAIAQALEKEPDEEIRSVRVYGDCYRCNWWVQDRTSRTMLPFRTGTIRKSRFIRATRAGAELVIEDVSRN